MMVHTDWFAVVFLAVAAFYLTYRWIKNREEALSIIQGFLFELTLRAEQLYGAGTGKAKKAYVMHLIFNGEFYKGLPFYIKSFVTENAVSELVDMFVGEVFNTLKDANKNIQNLLAR